MTRIGAVGHRISSKDMGRSRSLLEIIMTRNGYMDSRKIMGSMCGKMAMSTPASERLVFSMAGTSGMIKWK
jgi:hypothetical protein